MARARKPEYSLGSDLEFEEQAPGLRLLRPCLRPDIEIVAQRFRGQSYFVLQNPVSLQHYRVGPTEREIIAQLTGETTLGDIHERLKEQFKAEAPSFRDLTHFVLSLREGGMTVPEDEESKYTIERVARKRSQTDRRVIELSLTAQGELTIAHLDRAFESMARDLLAVATQEERAALLALAGRLETLPWVERTVQDGARLRVIVRDVDTASRALLPMLVGLSVLRFEMMGATLEDIFLQLTESGAHVPTEVAL